MSPTPDNPKGYGESKRFTHLNDSILAIRGCAWDHPPVLPLTFSTPECLRKAKQHKHTFSDLSPSTPWVAKDPRISITRPFYEHLLLYRPRCIYVIRKPHEVAISLYRRDGIPIKKGYALWYLYNLHCSRHINTSDDLLVSYADIVNLSERVSNSIDRFISDSFGQQCNAKKAKDIMPLHVFPTLQRATSASPSDEPDSLIEICDTLYLQLSQDEFAQETYSDIFLESIYLVADIIDELINTHPSSEEYLMISRNHYSISQSIGLNAQTLLDDTNLHSSLAELCDSLSRLSSGIVTGFVSDMPLPGWSIETGSARQLLRLWFSIPADLIQSVWLSSIGTAIQARLRTKPVDYSKDIDTVHIRGRIIELLYGLNAETDPYAWQLVIGILIASPHDFKLHIGNSEHLPKWLYDACQEIAQ